MTTDPIIFVHIPRTGGTSLRRIMEQNFSSIGQPGKDYARTMGHRPEMQECDAWLGHMPFGLHRFLERPVKYITILRDPAERVISEYRRRDIRNRFNQSPAEFAWARPELCDNQMVRHLAPVTKGTCPVEEKHVEQAKRNIEEHFKFVGRTDAYSAMVYYLKMVLGWRIDEIPHENRTAAPLVSPEDLWNHPRLEYDYQLYRWFNWR